MSGDLAMPHAVPWPAPEDVHRISATADPVVRNLQITQCYYELSQAMARLLPGGCNWCTMATWASRQAGQSIRKQDLRHTLGRLLRDSRDVEQALEELDREARTVQGGGPESLVGAVTALRDALSPQAAFERTSEAVARGNLKVFAEIGLEFARFLGLHRAEPPDSETVGAFTASLRAGEPPEGQDYLRQAFTHYREAMRAVDDKARAEWMLLANLEIGFHEQTRLQPEILEAMNAPVYDPDVLRRRLIDEILPNPGSRARFVLARILGRAQPLIDARDRLAAVTQQIGREAITHLMMSLDFPGGRTILLGRNLVGDFPPFLVQLNNPELLALLRRVDPTPDTLAATGAKDWSRLPERMHLIADLFRAFHQDYWMFDSPFTDEQTAAIKRGQRPPDI